MNDFLNTVKADLLDRRMLPFLVALAAAFVGAIAYAVLGGGSTATTPPVSSAPAHVAGILVSPAPKNANQPVAETTNGVALQRAGHANNPFRLLPGAAAAAAKASKTSPSSATTKASTKSEAVKSTPSTGSATPTAPSAPAPAPKPHTVYNVAVLFGVVPAGTAPGTAQLTPYSNLKLFSAFPSAKQALIVYRGVTSGGKDAVFTLVGEAIIHGNATCMPSTFQCQAIKLQPKQVEQLEYLAPSGEVVTYELRIASIAAAKASTASVTKAWASDAKAARQLLGQAGLLAVPGLSYSQTAGVLLATPRSRSGAHTGHAARRSRPRG
jgi:hypothetical protein